ncbi:MAG: glycosyltransferase [Xenococcaceae cyanobacterium]
MLGMVGIVGAIAASWFSGEGIISELFAQLHYWQQNPPMWLEVPEFSNKYYLLAPTVVLFLIAQGVMKISPQPRTWSRVIVVSILLALVIRYVLWRSLSTLNLSNPLDGVFSLGLFFLEMLTIVVSILQLYLILRVKDRRREADKYSETVRQGIFTPSVDILIPTYSEPAFMLRRTIVGCQALEYVNKKIYLLDDTRRPEIKQLAKELGCNYITRPNNRHAKAGNLNHALTKTSGELIAVFDADFVPTKNFLTRTVGFFQNEKIALVQTPQSFYNSDPIARNLGLEEVLTAEEELFYRYIQTVRDAAGGAVCAGTSFVVRRDALEAVGSFVTDSLSEDYFTGIRLCALGYQLIYLNEKLSAGLAAENMASYFAQRLRWGRGTLQAFFIDSNPLTISGLSPIQRLAHLEGLLSWFNIISRAGFLFMPLAYSFLGVVVLRTNITEFLYFFLPNYLVFLTTFSWLNRRSRSALFSEVYFVVLAFPLAMTVIQVMLNPFSKGFNVTPKGKTRERFVFNWALAWPLIILFVATAISLLRVFGIGGTVPMTPEMTELTKGINLVFIWSAYDLIIIGLALLVLLDVPKPDIYEWFELRRRVEIKVKSRFLQTECKKPTLVSSSLLGITTAISEGGAEVILNQSFPLIKGESVTLEILEEGIKLEGTIAKIGVARKSPTVRIMFEQISLDQYRRLVEMLFCRPGRWKLQKTPGELRSLWLLLRVLLIPRVLFNRNKQSVTKVSQI